MGCCPLCLGPMLQFELQRLKHKDVRQRRMAVRRLFEIDNSIALATFIELLDDDDDWFVEKAIDAIRRWVDSSHRKVVVTLSVHSEARLRHLAAELSPRVGVEALPILSTLCSDADHSVRREAWKSRLKVDAGTIPVAIENEDYVIRKMATEHSGDTDILEKMLSDDNLRVRETALNQMISLGHSPALLNQLLDGPLRNKAAKLRLPALIESGETSTIANLCRNPDATMRNIIAKNLDDVNWLSWSDVVDAARESADPLLLPRLLRSRRESEADDIRHDLLLNGHPSSRARILEHLHGRPLPEPIADLLPSLAEDSDPLIAQSATSLIADNRALETDA